MNNVSKKLISLALAVSMFGGTAAMAANFTDMPTDWTAEAMENAVATGLLNGYTDNTVKPNNPIRRAEMAAIVARCFKATKLADISKFGDVKEGQWFYEDFAKAVDMGAFGGDNLGNLNPEKNITFQETFKVMACLFGLIAYTNPKDSKNDLTTQDLTVLDNFADGASVAEWAKPYAAAIVSNGYWNGIDGYLYPNQPITRAQFAVLMYNLVKTYIDEPGEYTELSEGNIIIRTDGVTIDADKFDSSIIISDNVEGTEPTTINIDQLNNYLVVRGGGDKANFTGHLKRVVVIKPGITFYLNDTNVWEASGHSTSGSSINLGVLQQPTVSAPAEETPAEDTTPTPTEVETPAE